MKKLLLSITLCATLLATGRQAQAEKHYGKICLISAFIAASCWAGGAYYSSQEAALAKHMLDDLDPEELAALETQISKLKTKKYVLWGAAGASALVAAVSGLKKFNQPQQQNQQQNQQQAQEIKRLDEAETDICRKLSENDLEIRNHESTLEAVKKKQDEAYAKVVQNPSKEELLEEGITFGRLDKLAKKIPADILKARDEQRQLQEELKQIRSRKEKIEKN